MYMPQKHTKKKKGGHKVANAEAVGSNMKRNTDPEMYCSSVGACNYREKKLLKSIGCFFVCHVLCKGKGEGRWKRSIKS